MNNELKERVAEIVHDWGSYSTDEAKCLIQDLATALEHAEEENKRMRGEIQNVIDHYPSVDIICGLTEALQEHSDG